MPKICLATSWNPEDWTRGQLEQRAIGIGLTMGEARGTIDSAFRAAQPRELPR